MEERSAGLCCCCSMARQWWMDQENRSGLINKPAFLSTESTYINGPAQLKKNNKLGNYQAQFGLNLKKEKLSSWQ